MRFVLLTTGPADIIYSLENLRRDIAIILGSRLTTHIGTGADDWLLETVTELLAECLIGDAHSQRTILCNKITGNASGIIQDDGSRLHRHGCIDEIPSHLRNITEITRHAVG